MRKLEDYISIEAFAGLLTSIRSNMGTTDEAWTLWNDLSDEDLQDLSVDFYIQIRNKRPTSRVIWLYEKFDDGSDLINYLGFIIAKRFGGNFAKIYDAYFGSSYRPLENFSMTEIRTPDLTDIGKTKSKVKTNGSTGEYGFNSTEPVPSAVSETVSEAEEEDNIQTNTHTGTDTMMRSGHNGSTTTQKLLEEELAVRRFDYWEMVLESIDSILCLGIF